MSVFFPEDSLVVEADSSSSSGYKDISRFLRLSLHFLLGRMAMRRLENSYRLLARLVGQQQAALASTQAQQHGGGEEREQKGGRHGGWAAAGLGLGLVGLSAPLLADEKKEKTVFGKTKADRVRQFATADNVFDHFASYQVVSDRGES